MKRERLHLSQHQVIETYRDWSGRVYIAYSGGASVFIRDRKELVRFLKIPKSIPMRASLDSWLDSLAAADAERKGATAEPVGDANVPGSFDPLAHEEDPALSTKMIV
jgi:hypothetical protein